MKLCGACSSRFSAVRWTCPECGAAPPTVAGHFAFSPELAISGSGFKAEYFAGLARFEERNFWFRSRNRLLIWAMRRYFPHAQSLLEVGCGNGYVLRGLQQAQPGRRLAGSAIFCARLYFSPPRLHGI